MAVFSGHITRANNFNGAYGIRTHGLLNAIQTRSQLRQCPIRLPVQTIFPFIGYHINAVLYSRNLKNFRTQTRKPRRCVSGVFAFVTLNRGSRLFYFSYKTSSGSVTLKSTARSRKFCGVMVCSLSGRMDRTFSRISADFSTVCIRPKVKSKSSPEQNIP